jgi:hypothetical protein
MDSEALLIGRLFDDRGNRMSPSHARKAGIKYRYYVSAALLEGRAEEAGSVTRVPAAEIETLVARAIRERFKGSSESDDKSIIVRATTLRVTVQPTQLAISVSVGEDARSSDSKDVIRVPWRKQPAKRRREVLLPASGANTDARPIRSETRATLIAAIARGRQWLNELVENRDATPDRIAHREGCSTRKVNMTISLAFLSPALVTAALEGRLPRGVGVTRLCDMPAEWSRQHRALGLIP